MHQSYFKEATNAGWGVLRLIIGRRDVADYFNLGLSGLAGSLIAFLVAVALSAYLPTLLAGDALTEPAFQRVAISIILFLGQVSMAALALRQYKRLDGLIPYIVSDNWATFYTTLFSLVMVLINFDENIMVFVLTIAALIIAVNVARLIVTLSPLQILGFLVAQLAGVMISMLVIGALFPDVLAMQQEIIQSSLESSV